MKTFKNHWFQWVVCLSVFVGAGVGDTQAAETEKKLHVLVEGQQTRMWCWAASGRMIMAYSGTGTVPTQCEQSNYDLGRNDCCGTPAPAACVQGGWPDFEHYGHSFEMTRWGTALSFAKLRAEIDAGRPLGFAWGWTGGGGHYMVAAGYKVDAAGTRWVWIVDPSPVGSGSKRYVTYDEFVASAGHSTWDNEYGVHRPNTWAEVKDLSLLPVEPEDVGMGGGEVWLVGDNPVSGDQVFRWNGTRFAKISDVDGKRISVDPAGNAWVIDNAGDIYEYTNGSFVKRPWKAQDIGIGADGSVMIVGMDAIAGGYSLYEWNGTSWDSVPGIGATRVAVGPTGKAWVLNNAGDIYEQVAGGWDKKPWQAKDIGVGADGSVWMVGKDAATDGFTLYKWNGSAWTAKNGMGGLSVAVNPEGDAWVTNSANKVFRWQGE